MEDDKIWFDWHLPMMSDLEGVLLLDEAIKVWMIPQDNKVCCMFGAPLQ
jgi:hypothetical protein